MMIGIGRASKNDCDILSMRDSFDHIFHDKGEMEISRKVEGMKRE
jgi:hypothetical protein